MKTAFTGLVFVLALALAACDSGRPAVSGSPAAPTGRSGPTGLTGVSLPSPSGDGFCVDRAIIGDASDLIRAADQPFRRVAAFVGATQRILGADASSVQSSLGRFKLRQLVLTLNTLRLAVLGAAANYPGDFSVRKFTNALPTTVVDVSNAVGCAT